VVFEFTCKSSILGVGDPPPEELPELQEEETINKNKRIVNKYNFIFIKLIPI
jgi:hypothetical protein